MCGRFAVGDTRGEDWADWLGVDRDAEWPEPSWNVAPTRTAGIVGKGKERRGVALARWGLIPGWWKKPLDEFRATTFNARSEEAHEKPMFRDAWRKGRCLVPVIGYYEWKKEGSTRRPFFISLKGNAPGFCLAGLWAIARIGDEKLLSFTVLTCNAGEATRHLHPRSPVILPEADWDRWLEPGSEAMDLMRPAPDDRVVLTEVDAAVGKVGNDGPQLIEAVG